MRRLRDTKEMADRLAGFIRDYSARYRFDRLAVGLSGGIDSAVSAVLGAKAVGAENILGLIMPYSTSSPDSEKDAMEVAEKFGIPTERHEITPIVDAYFGQAEVSPLRRGNLSARARMAILFDVATRDKRLVLGTSNKTEICLGYATWYGDAACSLNPLGGLYKCEVWEMARHFGIPDHIISKKPSADLWPGQTDEGELGITYEMADHLLSKIIEERITSREALRVAGADDAMLDLIQRRLNDNAFKRALPAVDLLGGNVIPAAIHLV